MMKMMISLLKKLYLLFRNQKIIFPNYKIIAIKYIKILIIIEECSFIFSYSELVSNAIHIITNYAILLVANHLHN